MRIAKFPDGQRLAGEGVNYWSATSGTITFATGSSYSTGAFAYVAPNQDVANFIIGLVEAWLLNLADLYLDVAAQMLAQGLKVFTLTPNGGTAADSFSVVITGLNFAAGITVTIGGHVYTPSLADSSDISIAYAGELTAGTYDVLATNTSGATFTLPQSFTLT